MLGPTNFRHCCKTLGRHCDPTPNICPTLLCGTKYLKCMHIFWLSTSSLWRWNWHRVPKRRPTTIWRRGNTQKNIYNIFWPFVCNLHFSFSFSGGSNSYWFAYILHPGPYTSYVHSSLFLDLLFCSEDGGNKFLRKFSTCSRSILCHIPETGIVIVTAMIASNITDFIITPNVTEIIL